MKTLLSLVVCCAVVSCKTTDPAPKDVAVEVKKSEPLMPAITVPPLPPLPKHLAAVVGPEANPVTPAKAELGRMLFFDKRLSKDGSMSCSSCHLPERAYTTANALEAKVGGAKNKRNAPTMHNLGYHPSFYWDGRAPTLEAVSLAAWKGQLGADPATVAAALKAIVGYAPWFDAAFKEDPTEANVPMALASFFRVLTSGDSPYDRWQAGEVAVVSADVRHGKDVFTKSGCVSCHVPPMFSDYQFHAVGIGAGKPEAERDLGRFDATKVDADKGQFKTPSLRDVAVTGPYFHDGSVATLEEAIAVMARGAAPAAKLDPLFKPARLTPHDAAALQAFLVSLSGTSSYPTPPTLP